MRTAANSSSADEPGYGWNQHSNGLRHWRTGNVSYFRERVGQKFGQPAPRVPNPNSEQTVYLNGSQISTTADVVRARTQRPRRQVVAVATA